MSTLNNKDYYLGLDIGTNSIGWAVTDENYNLLRGKGKDLWGVRLFREAQTAMDRRMHRTARRLTDRKRERLQLLREIFEEEVSKIDPHFYERQAESKFWSDEKRTPGKYSLFNDKGFTDKEFFRKYPTIFHLRKALMEGTTNKDIRLYFLAIHQMMKRRGHFLFEGQKFDSISDISPYIASFQKILSEEDFGWRIEDEFFSELVEIMKNSSSKKTDKNYRFKKVISDLDLDKMAQKQLLSMTKLLVSGKTSLASIFDDKELDNLEKKDVEFFGEKYEADIEFFEENLGERVEVIKLLKAIYDYSKLQEVLHGSDSISKAQIERYEKHKSDLILLKRLVRKYDGKNKALYRSLFTDPNAISGYINYVGSTNKNGTKITVKKCRGDDFFKSLSSQLKTVCNESDSDFKRIMEEISNDTFLPLQIVSTNSVIPYQIHLLEMEKILAQLVKHFPSFLKVEDEITKAEKINLLFKFRIPYFVGPLNATHKGEPKSNTWIIKRDGFENTKVLPWNFEQVVDSKACEEEFIRRMTNQCTYLPDQKVLPKSSLAYSEYLVLNELNNLRIDGEKPTVEMKQLIYEEAFLKFKRVTPNKIKSILIANNKAFKNVVLSGFDEDFKSTMTSYIEFKQILGADFDTELAEAVIEMITIHAGNSELLRKKIKESYPNLTDDICKKLSMLKYKDWARFSNKFLNDFWGSEIETGETGSILYFLRNTNDNLMQLLSSRYTFAEMIKEYQTKFIPDKISYDVIDQMYASPSVKKMIWQVTRIADEIKKVMGADPKRIFIEMARGKEENPERKESRRFQFLKLYKSIKEDSRDWAKEIESRSEGEFRSKKLFLYYTQMGRCMYSGDPISLDELFTENLYDIDHIIPQSKKKDDSILSNLVLVKKNINQTIKRDFYPVPDEIRIKQTSYWKMLFDKELITKSKYERLIRVSPLSMEELAEFINRQLVETRQSTKLVAELFRQVYSKTKVVYVNAGLVSEFRQDFGFPKVRDINDLHHAHDAFLNVVIGNGYYTKFSGNPLEYLKQNQGKYSLNKLFINKIYGPGKKIVWDRDPGIKLVRKTLDKPSVLFTTEPYEQHGALYNATIESGKNINRDTVYLPLKTDDRLHNINRYGGYKSISGAYFFVVEHQVKKTRIKTIEFVPLYLKEKIQINQNALLDFCVENLQLKNPVIINDKILMKTLIEVDGFRYTMNGRTGNRIILQSATQPYWNQYDAATLKNILSCLEKSKQLSTDYCEDLVRANILAAFNMVQAKLNAPPYTNRINIPEIIKSCCANELTLTNLEICSVIKEILNLVKATNLSSDLTLLGGAKKAGISLLLKTIDQSKAYKIINQSPTGIYEKEVILN